MVNPIAKVYPEIRKRITNYNEKVNWTVFCFVFTFTIGAWLDLNGLWAEMTILVHELPEGWRLPSIVNFTIQIAQVTSLSFLLGRWLAPKAFTYARANYIILAIGSVSCLLLSFFWNKTAFIFGEERSIGLYVLNFCLAVLDGTSSITFLPYIGENFAKEYIIPNYVGESLAALIPSILSLSQGLGKDPGCHNVTTGNTTELVKKPFVLNYSVQLYFILIFVLLTICTIAFSLLHFSPIAIRERKQNTNSTDNDEFMQSDTVVKHRNLEINITRTKKINTNGKNEIILLSIMTYVICFLYYGFLPGIQSYATLPYGNEALFYSINLSNVGNFFTILLSIWSYDVSILRICCEFSVGMAFALYALILSTMSPCPPLLDSIFGPVLTVISQCVYQCMFMRVRCLIATRLERFGQRFLVLLGVMTMMGQLCGGVLVYVLVNELKLFTDKPDCVDDFNMYCK